MSNAPEIHPITDMKHPLNSCNSCYQTSAIMNYSFHLKIECYVTLPLSQPSSSISHFPRKSRLASCGLNPLPPSAPEKNLLCRQHKKQTQAHYSCCCCYYYYCYNNNNNNRFTAICPGLPG